MRTFVLVIFWLVAINAVVKAGCILFLDYPRPANTLKYDFISFVEQIIYGCFAAYFLWFQ